VEIEERSFVAALLWMTAKGGWCDPGVQRRSGSIAPRRDDNLNLGNSNCNGCPPEGGRYSRKYFWRSG
jgi:hypothetical protein